MKGVTERSQEGRREAGRQGGRGMGYISRHSHRHIHRHSERVCVGHMWALADMCSVCQQPTHKKGDGELRVDTSARARPPVCRVMNVRCDGRSFPQKWGRDRHSPSPSLFSTPHASWKLQIAPAMAGVSGWLVGWLAGCRHLGYVPLSSEPITAL